MWFRPFVAVFACCITLDALALEGHWLPEQLPSLEPELKALGVTNDPKDLARLDLAPLGAVVEMEGCSGAFVSDTGLIATAYHCVWDMLAHASESGENLVDDGFHATTLEEERWAGPNTNVRITKALKDVTSDVLAGTKKLSGREYSERVAANIKTLVRRCESGSSTYCSVEPFDHGTEYRLVETEELNDIRVVFSPPKDVGYFGGDADNWQWPRHSGDFAFVRAYAAPNGEPSSYAAGNVPYQPEHHLPVAKGPKPGEFVMVAGFPSGTFRWLTAAEIDYAKEEDYPRRIRTNHAVLDVLKDYVDEYPSRAARVQPRILSINNQTQYLEGNLVAFDKLSATDRKWKFEEDFAQWVVANQERQQLYGDVIDSVHRIHAESAATADRDHVARQMVRNGVMLQVSTRLYKLASEARKKDADRQSGFQNRDRPDLASWLDSVDSRYDGRYDKQVLRYFLKRALMLPSGSRIPELDVWLERLPHTGTADQKLEAELARLYDNTELTSADRRRALMDTSPWYLENTTKNPWFQLASALHPFFERLDDLDSERRASWGEVRPRYMEAVKAFFPEARPRVAAEGQIAPGLYYPDANGTLRVTIGKVDGYFPRDGLIAAPRSRVEGINEKAGVHPFEAPPVLLAAIEGGRFGPYGDDLITSVSVNYLSTADTTLGNSGSPTINKDMAWCGVLFDGNYESMATDWLFEERVTRSIHTDSSFVLWYLDAVAGADRLLEELGHKSTLDKVLSPTK
jgi:hypothetical protein